MKDETLLSDDLIHMAISAIEDLLDHCDPSTDHYCGVWADVPDKLRAALQSGNSAQPVTAHYAFKPDRYAELHMNYNVGHNPEIIRGGPIANGLICTSDEYKMEDISVSSIVKAAQCAIEEEAKAVPAGYVLVPVEPTITILDEIDAIFDFGAEDSKDAWHRLLAAAPKIPDAPKAKNVIGHYQGADGKEQDIITLAAKKGV